MKIFTNIIFLTYGCFSHFKCAESSGRFDLNMPLGSDGEPVRAEREHSHSPVRVPTSTATAALRERSRSPPPRVRLPHQLGDAGYKRLIPKWNPSRTFEFRRYSFPKDKRIRMLVDGAYPPMPEKEYIVLSTNDGEVFATVENMEHLRGIYSSKGQRLKAHMHSSTFERMKPAEVYETPVDSRRSIKDLFRVRISNYDSLQYLYNSIQNLNKV